MWISCLSRAASRASPDVTRTSPTRPRTASQAPLGWELTATESRRPASMEDLGCCGRKPYGRWSGCARDPGRKSEHRAARGAGSRHRRARLPRDRRRRLARAQPDLPRRAAPRRGARRRGAAARRDLHRLVVRRRAQRGGSDGRGVAGAARHRADPRAVRESTRPRTPFARSRSCDARGCLRGRAGLLDPALPPRALLLPTASTAATAYAIRYRYVVRPFPSPSLVWPTSSRRSRAWPAIVAEPCVSSTTGSSTTRAGGRSWLPWLPVADGENSVAMGSAVLSRAAAPHRSRATSRMRSPGRAGRSRSSADRSARAARTATLRTSLRASTRSPAAYDDAVARFARGDDPMDAPFPMHPSYEQREGVPDRSFTLVSPAAGRADGRRLVAADRRLARAAARAACCTCTT